MGFVYNGSPDPVVRRYARAMIMIIKKRDQGFYPV